MKNTIYDTLDIKVKKEILEWKRPSQYMLWITAGALVCVGTCDTIMAKLQARQDVYACDDCPLDKFNGPIWQTLISYILETALISVFFYDKIKAKAKKKSFNSEYVHLHTTAHSFVKPTCSFYLWAIPGFLDFLTSVGVNLGVMYLHASVLQLLRNFNIIATAILSLLWIRVALRVHQVLGVLLVTIGLIVIGIQEFMEPDKETKYSNPALGVILALLGTTANAVQVVAEEWLFRKYHVSPCESLGYFGIFGLIFSFLTYAILEIIGKNNKDVETLGRVFYSLSNNSEGGRVLIITTCVLMCSICMFNLTGMTVTKLGSCLLRMIVISLRTFTIWIVELIIWTEFKVLVLIGLLITILGVLSYNYNYMVEEDCWKYDLLLRKPLMFGSFLKDPKVLEAEMQTEILMCQQQFATDFLNTKDKC